MEGRVIMEEEASKINKFRLEASPYAYIKIGIWIVMKCNFNDERLIENVCIPVQELVDNPIVYLDLFNVKCKNKLKKIAFTSLSSDKLTAIIDDGDKKQLCTINSVGQYFTEDYNETMLISAHVTLHKNKENWW